MRPTFKALVGLITAFALAKIPSTLSAQDAATNLNPIPNPTPLTFPQPNGLLASHDYGDVDLLDRAAYQKNEMHTYNLGSMEDYVNGAAHEFSFFNASNKPVRLQNYATLGSCITDVRVKRGAQFRNLPQTLAPHEPFILVVALNYEITAPGRFSDTVLLMDEKDKTLGKIAVKANFLSPLAFFPSTLFLKVGERQSVSLRIDRRLAAQLMPGQIFTLQSNSPRLRVGNLKWLPGSAKQATVKNDRLHFHGGFGDALDQDVWLQFDVVFPQKNTTPFRARVRLVNQDNPSLYLLKNTFLTAESP